MFEHVRAVSGGGAIRHPGVAGSSPLISKQVRLEDITASSGLESRSIGIGEATSVQVRYFANQCRDDCEAGPRVDSRPARFDIGKI